MYENDNDEGLGFMTAKKKVSGVMGKFVSATGKVSTAITSPIGKGNLFQRLRDWIAKLRG